MKSFSLAQNYIALVAIARGAFPSAKKLLIESLEFADSDDEYGRICGHILLAFTYHSLGEILEAQKNFTKSREILGKPFYSLDGLYEAEHLLALGNEKRAYEHTESSLTVCERYELIKDISLCHIMLGLLSLPDSITEARKHLKVARDWTDQSGYMEGIIRSHILSAEIAYCAQDIPSALSEATIGLNLAEGCGYGKFAIDLLLQLAKIHLSIPDSRTALSNARKALDRSMHIECRYAWGEANALRLCGVCHDELGEAELAEKRLKTAYKLHKLIQHPDTDKIYGDRLILSSSMYIAQRFFQETGFDDPKFFSDGFLLLSRDGGHYIAASAEWGKDKLLDQLQEILQLHERPLGPRFRFYIIYEESQQSTNKISEEGILHLCRTIDCDIVPLWLPSLEEALKSEDCEAALQTLENPYVIRTDPYDEANPVDDQLLFFGRSDLLEQVPQLLAQGQHVGIFGLRRVGKTSLLSQLQKRLWQVPVARIEVDALGENKASQLLSAIRISLKRELERFEVILPPEAESEEFTTAVSAMFRAWRLRKRADPFVVVIDEVDRLLPAQSAGNKDLLREYATMFQVLRAAAQTERSLVLLIAAFRPNVNRRNLLSSAVGDNPMWTQFKEVHLGFLSAADSEKMLVDIGSLRGIEWDQTAAQNLFYWCGGHPLVTRIAASIVCRRGRLRRINLDRVQQSMEKIISTFRRNLVGNYYREGVRNLLDASELQILKLIVDGIGEVQEIDIPAELEEALTNLENFGLISVEDHQLRITARLFSEWLLGRIA